MPPTLAALAARLRARGRGEVLELPVSRLRELEGGRGEVALRLAEGLQVTRIGELLDALGDGEDSPQLEGREARLLARALWAWATRLPLRATVTWEPGEAVEALAIPDVPFDADGLGEWAARRGVIDLLDETVSDLGDVSLAQFAPDVTLASLWRPGAVPRLVRPEFYAYLVHQAKEAAAARLGEMARARALAEGM
ncbi:MAG: hypothetical protein KC486_29770, partial [Myxococcales bacterium]|nr:hypothetical protein [Myxococcales bacterium]